MKKVQLNNPWRLFYKGDGYAATPVVRISDYDSKEISEVLMNEREVKFNSYGDFYGFPHEAILEEACVVPSVLFEFQVRTSTEFTYRVAISKCSNAEDLYSMSICVKTPDFKKDTVSHQMNGMELSKVMQHFDEVFSPYLFVQLPFGNCFSV